MRAKVDDTVWQVAVLLCHATDAFNEAQGVVERDEFGMLAKMPRTLARPSREIARVSTANGADPPAGLKAALTRGWQSAVGKHWQPNLRRSPLPAIDPRSPREDAVFGSVRNVLIVASLFDPSLSSSRM
jgi:hypothetical protein